MGLFVLFNVCFGLVCGEVKRTGSGILFPLVLIFLTCPVEDQSKSRSLSPYPPKKGTCKILTHFYLKCV